MDLAVLGAVRGLRVGADVGLEDVEAEGDNLEEPCQQPLGPSRAMSTHSLVGGDAVGIGILIAAAAGSSGPQDLDLIGAGLVGRDLGDQRAGGGDGREEERDGMHFGWGGWLVERTKTGEGEMAKRVKRRKRL